MEEITLNGEKMIDKETTHAYLKEKLALPEHYGANLDALWDCLSSDFSQKKVTILNSAIIYKNLGNYGESIIELFEDLAAENDNIILCIEK